MGCALGSGDHGSLSQSVLTGCASQPGRTCPLLWFISANSFVISDNSFVHLDEFWPGRTCRTRATSSTAAYPASPTRATPALRPRSSAHPPSRNDPPRGLLLRVWARSLPSACRPPPREGSRSAPSLRLGRRSWLARRAAACCCAAVVDVARRQLRSCETVRGSRSARPSPSPPASPPRPPPPPCCPPTAREEASAPTRRRVIIGGSPRR